MIPDVFHLVGALPMTSGSKVDERALLASAGLAEWGATPRRSDRAVASGPGEAGPPGRSGVART